MRFLVVESETKEDREARRESAGKSAGESYAATLEQLCPGALTERVTPSDAHATPMSAGDIGGFDAVFVSGSPLHVYDRCPEVDRQLDFMRAVFASGTPSFGSCAGLQLAVAAAGGSVRKMPRMEAAIARRITATDAGRDHPLLAGRPAAWDAPAIHGDEVESLPSGSRCLATNGVTAIQAAEIRFGRGVFWGVQYHPELAPGEIAAALRRQAADLVDAGLGEGEAEIEERAGLLDRLHRNPDSRSARWLLGVDDEFAVEARRRRELINFLGAVPDLRTYRERQVKTELAA
ncbi:GMP synthase (glutamine-hydrolysing) [Sphingomonas guangdongensis]|uniref:GMP synthase (Glutamine-hydrolysing) n=1 Tax=Sphingomonas guangdongensis TaxID=1141890 RepID=A0A285QXH1_9SPHN|nr:type 1 glutamine amidotransferase [Sphingomonas guangdongensis]SOB86613.1 GMP synthase (glutamine-hydrolysing) [Sphingomonas guangdongensis]